MIPNASVPLRGPVLPRTIGTDQAQVNGVGFKRFRELACELRALIGHNGVWPSGPGDPTPEEGAKDAAWSLVFDSGRNLEA